MKSQSNLVSGYEQFTYGQLDPYEPEGLIAVSPILAQEDKSVLQTIAKHHSFWKYPLENTEKQAVGTFFLDRGFVGETQSFLVLLKAETFLTRNNRSHAIYHYVFIPVEDLESLTSPNCLYELLIWFANCGPIPQNDNQLGTISIPMLSSQRLNNHSVNGLKDCLAEINALLTEKDNQNRSYLFIAISSLLNGQQILLNSVPPEIIDPLIFLRSIIRLFPATCRHKLSVSIGNFDEAVCSWSQILIKLVESSSLDFHLLPRNCIWLNRSGSAISTKEEQSYNPKHAGFEYVNKLREILTQSDVDWSLSLIQELDQQIYSTWDLDSLKTFPADISNLSRSINIGLWGIAGSGKTTYILQLFQSASKDSSGFKIQPLDDVSDTFVRKKLSELSTKGYISPTPETDKIKVISYAIQTRYTLVPQVTKLSFIDAPGEVYFQLATTTDTEKIRDISVSDELTLAEYLSDCHGIIFLLKPSVERPERSELHQDMIPNVLRFLCRFSKERGKPLGRNERLTQFMAFCATKVDKEEYWETRNNPDELVKAILGEAVNQLDNYCYYNGKVGEENQHDSRCKFFAIASIGRYKNEFGEWEEAVEYSDINESTKPSSNPLDLTRDESKEESSVAQTKGSNDVNAPDAQKRPSLALFGGGIVRSDNTPASAESSKQAVTHKLKQGITPEPYNVVEPVKWLIRQIYAHAETIE